MLCYPFLIAPGYLPIGETELRLFEKFGANDRGALLCAPGPKVVCEVDRLPNVLVLTAPVPRTFVVNLSVSSVKSAPFYASLMALRARLAAALM